MQCNLKFIKIIKNKTKKNCSKRLNYFVIKANDCILDNEACGKAGDTDGIKRQVVKFGNVAGGTRANAGAWPWHGIVAIRRQKVILVRVN